jgi:nitrogen fixation NifU-like protein
MNDEMDDLIGKRTTQIGRATTGACKPEDYEKWLKPLYLGLMDIPSGYSPSTGSAGDRMRIFLRFEGDKVKQAAFQTAGSIAGSLCCFFTAKLAIGKGSDELAEITGEKIIDFMGGLPEEDRHYAFLAAQTLRRAIFHYRTKNLGKRLKLLKPNR